MATPNAIRKAAGFWKGTSKLHLPWLEESERIKLSESNLSVSLGSSDGFATILYDWVYDEARHEGAMLCAKSGSGPSASIGWVDSWHQDGSVMLLTGEETSESTLSCRGSYSAPASPDWGWRIELELASDDTFVLRMVNIEPSGAETWAVDAHYQRQPAD